MAGKKFHLQTPIRVGEVGGAWEMVAHIVFTYKNNNNLPTCTGAFSPINLPPVPHRLPHGGKISHRVGDVPVRFDWTEHLSNRTFGARLYALPLLPLLPPIYEVFKNFFPGVL